MTAGNEAQAVPDRSMDAIIFRLFGLPRRVKHQEGE